MSLPTTADLPPASAAPEKPAKPVEMCERCHAAPVQVPVRYSPLHRGVPPPSPDELWREAEGLVVLGGPMGAYEADRHPWLKPELALLGEVDGSLEVVAQAFVAPGTVRALWSAHGRGVRDHAPKLWGLMMLELWQRTFVDRPGHGPVAS